MPGDLRIYFSSVWNSNFESSKRSNNNDDDDDDDDDDHHNYLCQWVCHHSTSQYSPTSLPSSSFDAHSRLVWDDDNDDGDDDDNDDAHSRLVWGEYRQWRFVLIQFRFFLKSQEINIVVCTIQIKEKEMTCLQMIGVMTLISRNKGHWTV